MSMSGDSEGRLGLDEYLTRLQVELGKVRAASAADEPAFAPWTG